MSSSHPAIAVRGLSKSYTIRCNQTRHTTLADALVERIKRPFRRAEKEVFWALRDLSFEIAPGEIVGIIGRNGAGKSTLLKILSRITRPTTGEVELCGRVGSLLEVGTGFHQELTGRENIFLSGTILGMKRREIKGQFDAIVEFAGVEQFLDTPVKRYSSGMYVRLAFAVAAHLSSEILLVDEVLAVGDAEFQKKCLGKMQDVATSGRTVLFVSHHMHSITQLCNRGIVLGTGNILFEGEVTKAVACYLESLERRSHDTRISLQRPGTGEYRYDHVRPTKANFDPGEPKRFRFEVTHVRGQAGRFYLSALLFNANGYEIAQFDSRLVGCWLKDAPFHYGEFCFASPWLQPGKYRMDVYLCSPSGIIDLVEGACYFDVTSLFPYPSTASADSFAKGLVLSDFKWTELPPVSSVGAASDPVYGER